MSLQQLAEEKIKFGLDKRICLLMFITIKRIVLITIQNV